MSTTEASITIPKLQGEPAEKKMVGKRVKPRKDVPLLKGAGIFTDDIKLPDMLYAAFVRSPYAHAKIKKVDASRALQLEGVVWVLTGREAARQLVS